MKRIFNIIIMLLALITFVNALDWTDLEAYYDFDGGSLTDLTGNGHDATNNGATSVTGKIGQAYDFESTESDWMNIGTGFDLSGTQPFTFNVWVNTETATGEILCYNPSSTNYFKIQLATGHYYFQRANQYIDSATTVNTGSWEMLTMTYDGSTIKEYRNGTYITSLSSTTSYSGGTNLFNIGRRPTAVAYYDGIIDEVSIWYRNLSSTEVSELYNGGSGLQYSPTPSYNVNITILNITVNGDLFVNNTIFGTNTTNFVVNYNVTDSYTSFIDYQQLNLTNQPNGIYYIQFNVSYNGTSELSGNYTYTINSTTAILFDSVKINGIELNPTSENYFNTHNLFINVTLDNISTNSNIDTKFFLYQNDTPWQLIDSRYFMFNTLQGGTNISDVIAVNDTNYRIYFYAQNNETNTTTGYYYFTLDTINPIISHNIPTEINSYNLTGVQINITDLNPSTCIINIDSTNYNCSSFTGHNFTTNGYKNWTITATDLAGNQDIETGTLLVNPYAYIYFEDDLGNPITNFTFGGQSYTNYVNATIYNDILSLGNNSYTFSKTGLITTNFYVDVTNTSNINITLTVNRALIVVTLYDRHTGDLFNQTVNVEILNLINGTTSNGTITFYDTSYPAGQYTIKAIADGYYPNQKVFTYSGEEEIHISLYLLSTTLNTTSTLTITNYILFDTISGADVRLLEYDNSILGYKEVSQQYSNSDGQVSFLVEQGTKTYIITSTKTIGSTTYTAQSSDNGEVFYPTISNGVLIYGNAITKDLYLKFSSALQIPALYGLLINVPENEQATIVSENSTHILTYLPINWTSTNGLDYNVCLTYYIELNGNQINFTEPLCLESSSGILPTSQISLNKDYTYKAIITVTYNQQTTIIKSYTYLADTSLTKLMEDMYIVHPIMILIWVSILALALYMKNVQVFAIGSIVLSVVQVIWYPTIFIASGSVIITLISLGILYLSRVESELK